MNFASPAFNNKAFAYLACGIPILNGALGDLAELIAEQDVGVNVPAGDAAALAASIKALVDDPGRVAAMKARVRDLYAARSEEHTSELQSLMRISYAVFCLKKKKHNKPANNTQ